MLAFAFATAQKHYENRIQLQIDEVILTKNVFMQADLAPEPSRGEARNLLLEFVEGRLDFHSAVEDNREQDALKIL